MSIEQKRMLIEPQYEQISVQVQCRLLGLSRSSYYYKPLGESEENLTLMLLIDKLHLKRPFLGAPRITAALKRQGYEVNHKRIERLMRLMNISAIYPKPNTSKPAVGHKVYPYLLRNVQVIQPNQVWSIDITYIPMAKGFLYLVAIIDWFSRFVLAWELSNNMERFFCIETLKKALQIETPSIFNTDQGSQFTSNDFTKVLLDKNIQISMDGRGRALDNIFIERLWRSVKYEEIYLHEYLDGKHLWKSLDEYFKYYNYERDHQSLKYKTPAEVYFS